MWIVPWDPFLIFSLNKVAVGPINNAWTVLNSTWTSNFVHFKTHAPKKKKKMQSQNSNMDPNPPFLVESGYTRQKVSWKRRKEKRKKKRTYLLFRYSYFILLLNVASNSSYGSFVDLIAQRNVFIFTRKSSRFSFSI